MESSYAPRNNLQWKSLVLQTISAIFILLFTYAAITKLLHYETFSQQLEQFPLLSSYNSWIAWMIPGAEIMVSLMLFSPRFRFSGLLSALSLMLIFTIYIFYVLNFSSSIPCSCGGVLQQLGWTEHLIFNVIFLLLALAGIVIIRQKPGIL